MGNTARKLEPELTPEIEQWLREEVVPLANAIDAGEIKCIPLMDSYEQIMENLAKRRKARKK